MAGYSVTFSVVDEATAKIEAINRRIRQMREPIERQARAVQKLIDASGLGKIAAGFTAIARTALDAFSSLSRLVPVMGTLTGATSIAGMAALVKSWADWAVVLRTDADRIGTTAQQLQLLQDATRSAGGSVEDMTESLKGLTDTAAQAFRGVNPQALAWFNRAGINLRDMNGHLRATTDLLPEVLRYLDSLKNPADRMTAAVNLGSAALYRQTEALERARRPGETLIQTYQRLNAEAAKRQMITAEDIARSQRFAEATGTLTTAIEHLGHTIGSAMSGPLSTAEEKITRLIDQLDQSPDAVAKLTTAVELLSAALGVSLVAALAKATTALAGWVASPAVARLMVVAAAVEGLRELTGEAGRRSEATGESYGRALAEELLLPRWVQDLIQPEYGKKRTAREKAARGGETFGPPIPPELMPRAAPAPQVYGPGGTPPANVPGYGSGGTPPANVPGYGSGGTPPANVPGYGSGGTPPANVPGYGSGRPAAPMSGDHTEFIRRVTPLALEASKRTGVDPRVIVAQAALESNWGKSAPGNNYFGIKGPGGSYATQEFEGGRMVTKQQSFAGYGSIEESFKGYADFINRNPRYQGLKTAPGLDAQIAALGRSGYATDPRYAEKIAAIAGRLAAPTTALAQATPPPPVDLGQYRSGLAPPRATGAPAQVTGGAPVNGSVDVTITHKNPPPGASLAANATGDGINLAPPRTERQQLNAA